MNTFGFNVIQVILGLVTFSAGGIFFGFMLMFVKFIMFGFLDIEKPKSGKEVKIYD